MPPKTSIRNIGSTSANSTAVAPSLVCFREHKLGSSHCVSISALRLIVPLGTNPKFEKIGEKLWLAVIVTNLPGTPRAQLAGSSLPQVHAPGEPVGQY